MSKLEVIVDVHQLKKQGFSISAIARKCNLSRTTVYEYLEMDYEEACRWVDVLKTRKRKLDPYEDKILNWLKEHPDLTASQISDWLEEYCEFNTVGESTVRIYVKELREKYHIPKSLTFRRYEAVEELASMMGDQDVGSIPVVENGNLRGMITDRDLVIRGIASQFPLDAPVNRILSSDVAVTGTPDMEVENAADLMANNQVRRLPIVEDNKVVGIIALADVAVDEDDPEDSEVALEEISKEEK